MGKSQSELVYFISETHYFPKKECVIVVNLVGPLARQNEPTLQECLGELSTAEARWVVINFRDVPVEQLSPGSLRLFHDWQLEARKRGIGIRFSSVHPALRERLVGAKIASQDELVDNLAAALQSLTVLAVAA